MNLPFASYSNSPTVTRISPKCCAQKSLNVQLIPRTLKYGPLKSRGQRNELLQHSTQIPLPTTGETVYVAIPTRPKSFRSSGVDCLWLGRVPHGQESNRTMTLYGPTYILVRCHPEKSYPFWTTSADVEFFEIRKEFITPPFLCLLHG